MAGRLRAVLPTGRFPQPPPAPLPSVTPILDGLLSGLGAAWSFCYDLFRITKMQMRIATATGGFLDLIAADYFAQALPREVGESDATFRTRILGNLLVRRGTRQALSSRIAYSTGIIPVIMEPVRAADCGTCGGVDVLDLNSGGYCTQSLRYGSNRMEFQYLITVSADPAFAPGLATSRGSPASYANSGGSLLIAPPMTVRPLYNSGMLVGALIEDRSFNLITDSRNWTALADVPGSAGTWTLRTMTDALLPTDAVLSLAVAAGSSSNGPSVAVAAGGAAACGSVWILIEAGSSLTEAHLSLTDLVGGSSVSVPADMALTGVWQRLQATLTTRLAAGNTLRMSAGATAAARSETLLTQCWQIEPGTVATSYIPTSGALGLRDADIVETGVLEPVTVMPPAVQVYATFAATQPIATIGWTAVVLPILPG